MRIGSPPIVAVLLGLSSGCDAGPSAPPPVAASPAPAASSAARVAAPPRAARTSKPTTFTAADGTPLAGELLVADDPLAPAVVLVHRFRGERSELAPLLDRLARAEHPFSVLSLDLRGHGASRSSDPKRSIDWTTMKPKDVEALPSDVKAGIAHVLQSTGGKARSVILVGSSLGAALVAKVAFDEPKVTALALISPGAAIQGIDVYRPYAEVRNLPTLLAGASDDSVSREPLDALSRMAQAGTVKKYAGQAHSARFLGEANPAFWDDLFAWIESVREQAPTPRQSLYYAEGKQPKPAKPSGRAAGKGR